MRALDCSICGNNFTTNHNRQVTCSKECTRILRVEQVKRWRKQNPDSLKSSDLRKRYWPHLSKEEALDKYETLLKLQNYRCAICGQPETSKTKAGKLKELSVDHCHRTGVVRGLLCYRCNAAVGLLKDDTQIAQNLIAYLVQ